MQRITRRLVLGLVAIAGALEADAQTAIPPNYALPASAVDTSKPGFLVRPYQTDATLGGTLASAESQLAGQLGPNTADLTGANAQGYLSVGTVVNWNINPGGTVDSFPAADAMPGISSSTVNFTEEVLTYLSFSAAGTYTLGVNSDDGFGVAAAAVNPKDQASALEVGQFNGTRGSGDTLFPISISQAGVYPFRLVYFQVGGGANVSWFSVVTNGATSTQVLINDAASSSAIKAYQAVTSANAYAQKVDPGVSATGVLPNEGIHIQMVDGATPLAASSIHLALDNAAVTPSISKTGSVTYIDYSTSAPWDSQSQHNVSFSYADGTRLATNTWSFTVQYYISLDPAWRATNVDTSKSGFNWNIFANGDAANTHNSNERAEADLSLGAVDANGAVLPNLANPAAQGSAAAPGVASGAPNGLVHFEIATTINVDIGPPSTMPGAPSTDNSTDGQAAEVLTYLDLPAGVIAMEVDSDDGWRLYSGPHPADVFGRAVVSEHNSRTGPFGFSFAVSQAGLYPFRLIFENGNGGSHLKWSSVSSTGTRTLINDTGGIKAYRALAAGTATAPSIVGTRPIAALHQQEIANTNLTVILMDGTNTVTDSSVTLTVDGKSITPVSTRKGNYLTVSDGGTAFPGLQLPGDVHSATLTFKDSGGTSRSQTWNFVNIQILILPASPLVQENFDSYPEATSVANTVPPGWTAWNYTAPNTPGWDLTDKSSDSYKNWIIISTDTTTAIEGSALSNDQTQTINGQPVANFASGNVLWATSDGRSQVQAQFCTSKPFDLSSITNPVMIFSSLMRMSAEANEQSNGIEYSTDGGTTWNPGIVYVTIAHNREDNVILQPNGSIDAVRTLNAPFAVLNYVDPVTGKTLGGTPGSGLAGPVTQDLAPLLAPRSDNVATSTKVDGIRLPKASKQKSVILRFFQLGNCSWWWGVDNLAFYDIASTVAPPAASPPQIDSIQIAQGSVTIKWSNGGTLEASPTLTSPTWTSTGNSSGSFSESVPGTGNKFYRVRQ
jgi:hypothetical protein